MTVIYRTGDITTKRGIRTQKLFSGVGDIRHRPLRCFPLKWNRCSLSRRCLRHTLLPSLLSSPCRPSLLTTLSSPHATHSEKILDKTTFFFRLLLLDKTSHRRFCKSSTTYFFHKCALFVSRSLISSPEVQKAWWVAPSVLLSVKTERSVWVEKLMTIFLSKKKCHPLSVKRNENTNRLFA